MCIRDRVLRDYIVDSVSVASAEAQLSALSGEKLVDLAQIANVMGLEVLDATGLDRVVFPRGIRALSLVPRLPWSLIKEVTKHWHSLPELREASVADLQQVEGIGPYRAKLIHDNLAHQFTVASTGTLGW